MFWLLMLSVYSSYYVSVLTMIVYWVIVHRRFSEHNCYLKVKYFKRVIVTSLRDECIDACFMWVVAISMVTFSCFEERKHKLLSTVNNTSRPTFILVAFVVFHCFNFFVEKESAVLLFYCFYEVFQQTRACFIKIWRKTIRKININMLLLLVKMIVNVKIK